MAKAYFISASLYMVLLINKIFLEITSTQMGDNSNKTAKRNKKRRDNQKSKKPKLDLSDIDRYDCPYPNCMVRELPVGIDDASIHLIKCLSSHYNIPLTYTLSDVITTICTQNRLKLSPNSVSNIPTSPRSDIEHDVISVTPKIIPPLSPNPLVIVSPSTGSDLNKAPVIPQPPQNLLVQLQQVIKQPVNVKDNLEPIKIGTINKRSSKKR